MKLILGFIRARDPSRISEIKQDIETMMGKEVMVLTYAELIAYEQAYWQNSAPIGFIFGMGVIMGLMVGMVIVYQILFTEISNNLSQFATLKAMGYPQSYLVKVVFAWPCILPCLDLFPDLPYPSICTNWQNRIFSFRFPCLSAKSLLSSA